MTTLPLVQCCAPITGRELGDDEARQLERLFKAMADRHRVKVVNRLLQSAGDMVCVCEFEDMLGLKQSTVSYHLKQLLDAGLLVREKRGAYAYYGLADGAIERFNGLLAAPAPA